MDKGQATAEDSRISVQKQLLDPKPMVTHNDTAVEQLDDENSNDCLKTGGNQAQTERKQERLQSHEAAARRDSIQTDIAANFKEIKMMDTITFVNGFQPVNWIFTDLLGKIQRISVTRVVYTQREENLIFSYLYL